MRRRSGPLPEAVAAYLARCSRVGDCIVGPGRRYGVVRHDGGRQTAAHRASYMVHHGPIPEGMVVRHSCDNPPCVNPDHLSIGTYADNERDKIERGRHTFGLRCANASVPPETIRAAIERYLQGGVSQAEMAAQLGVVQSAFGRWVRGEGRQDVDSPAVSVGRGSRIAAGVQPCGTRAGYGAHRRRGEAACDPCREANTAYLRAYKAQRRAAA